MFPRLEHRLLVGLFGQYPFTSVKIKASTRRDPESSLVSLKPYYARRDKLTLENGCIIWRQIVVIPQQHRQSIVNEVHVGYPGVCRMKAITRSIIWWPKMDVDLEAKVKTCEKCLVNQKMLSAAPLHPWEYPHKP